MVLEAVDFEDPLGEVNYLREVKHPRYEQWTQIEDRALYYLAMEGFWRNGRHVGEKGREERKMCTYG